jgi:hypothetical protein
MASPKRPFHHKVSSRNAMQSIGCQFFAPFYQRFVKSASPAATALAGNPKSRVTGARHVGERMRLGAPVHMIEHDRNKRLPLVPDGLSDRALPFFNVCGA